MCPVCRQPMAKCHCRGMIPGAPNDGIVRLMLERKGRKGAGVTLVTGLALDAAGLKELASVLKKKCGVGGSVKQSVIEIQGDQRQLLKAELENRGWKVKLAGG